MKVEVVCVSGIPSNVYQKSEIRLSTAHAFYGLQTANLPCHLVADHPTQVTLGTEKSRRVYELANKIHLEPAPKWCDSSQLFRGIEVLLVGEFLQVCPLAINYFDLGKFVFSSPLLIKVIPHRIEVISIMRQNEEENPFISCLKEIHLEK